MMCTGLFHLSLVSSYSSYCAGNVTIRHNNDSLYNDSPQLKQFNNNLPQV